LNKFLYVVDNGDIPCNYYSQIYHPFCKYVRQ